jgi:hypothetical protein
MSYLHLLLKLAKVTASRLYFRVAQAADLFKTELA